MQESDKAQARELLIKSKVYRFLALIFAVVGLGLLLFLYMKFYEGDVMKLLHDPFAVIFMIFPFVPSIVLSLRAKKADKMLQKLIVGAPAKS